MPRDAGTSNYMDDIALERSAVAVLLRLLPSPALTCDARGRITASNAEWNAYVGEFGARRGWWLSDRLLHPADVADVRERWKQARQLDARMRATVRLRRFDGSWRTNVLVVDTLPVEHGVQQQWIAAWTDVESLLSDRHDALDKQQLERLRSDIVATVGHELRTPLTSIYGMAITLQRRDTDLSELARRELLDVIVDQSLRMTATIDDFLAAGTLERGRLSLQVRPCDVTAVSRSVVDAMQRAAPADVRIRLHRVTTRAVARADETRLRQVLTNLVENAVKYSPGGGDVQLRVRRSGADVCVDVADHGLGIPHQEQPHVFERFHRLDPAHSRGVAGSGLGLYIARELARRMGGDITVRSRAGRGSTFTLRLPAA